jgi:spore germination protein
VTANGPIRKLSRAAVAASLAVAVLATPQTASADSLPRRIVNGWLPYWSMPASLASVTANPDLWGDASPFWYQATGATAITGHPGAGDVTVRDALHDRGITVIPSVTETLTAPAMAALLSSPVQRAAHVTALADLVTTNGYDGIDLDYETMNSGGTATDKTAVRTGFVALARELGAVLDARGKLLSITVGPRTRATDPSWAVFDYAGLGAFADRFRIMTYDHHWRNGVPGAVAPLPWVDTVIAYATTAVPRAKVDIGVPLYGYDWPADPTQPDGYGTAASLTYQQAEALRAQYGAVRQYSTTDAAPSFVYTTAAGVRHVVWYNDVDATKAKMNLVGRYAVHGLAFWAVGSEDARQWPALRSYAVQRSTKLTVSAPATITYGATATISGKLTSLTGAALAGQKVVLQWRPSSTAAWRNITTATTSSTGAVSLTNKPASNVQYRLASIASWGYLATASPAVTTQVRPRITAAFADSTVKRGTTIKLTGKVAPVRAGTVVQRQRYLGPNKWAFVSSTTVRADGTYAFSFAWNVAGTYAYRVVTPATSLNAPGTSNAVTVKVS